MESYDPERGTCAVRNAETGELDVMRCEPTGRNRSQEKIGGTMLNENIAITNYADGHITEDGGAALDRAAKRYMDKSGEKDYRKAINEAIIGARVELREDRAEFRSRTRNYQSHFRINEAEARKRVIEHDPRMRAVYFESDPFGPVNVVGEVAPPAVGKVTVQPWTPPVHEPIAIIQVANLLFGLPRDENMYVTLDQCAQALAPYPDTLDRAAGDKFDGYARTEISIQGKPGSVSENYPAALEAARRRYPALAALWATGRLTSQTLRELLPQILIRD